MKASQAIHRKDHRKARFRYTDYSPCVRPVFCCYRFFQLPLPRLLLGDFSISDLRRMPMFDMENVQAAWEERDKEMLKVLLHGYVWNHIEG